MTLFRPLAGALALLAIAAVPVRAADNYQVKDASGTTITIRAKDCGSGVLCPASVPIAPDGTPYSSANGQPVTVVGPAPLPTGAATAAGQATGNTSLASIDARLAGGVIHLPSSGNGSVTAVTAGTTSAQALAASGTRRFLAVVNESTANAIACAFGSAAALNTAGSFTIPPGATRTWTYGVPTEAVNCISAAASTPVTVQAF